MQRLRHPLPIALLLAVAGGVCGAQTAAPPPLIAAAASGPRTSEPAVRQVVIEDEAMRIEELAVRGQVQRITVTPRGADRRGYEIITGDGSRELSDGAGSTRGATGKRVWHVFSF